eukprot:m51a1_g13006 hypothetical protein (263) ;mRNA; r:196-1323
MSVCNAPIAASASVSSSSLASSGASSAVSGDSSWSSSSSALQRIESGVNTLLSALCRCSPPTALSVVLWPLQILQVLGFLLDTDHDWGQGSGSGRGITVVLRVMRFPRSFDAGFEEAPIAHSRLHRGLLATLLAVQGLVALLCAYVLGRRLWTRRAGSANSRLSRTTSIALAVWGGVLYAPHLHNCLAFIGCGPSFVQSCGNAGLTVVSAVSLAIAIPLASVHYLYQNEILHEARNPFAILLPRMRLALFALCCGRRGCPGW